MDLFFVGFMTGFGKLTVLNLFLNEFSLVLLGENYTLGWDFCAIKNWN